MKFTVLWRNTTIHKKRKIVKSCIFGGLLLILYLLIFSFSEQDGEESGRLSFYISRLGVEIWNKVVRGNWTEEILESMAHYWENPVRKFAHFAEYTVMGILVTGILNDWIRNRKKYAWMLLWIFVSASMDELHQVFVPDRCGCFADVLLDTCGGAFGIFLFWLFLKIIKMIHDPETGNKKIPDT